MIDHLSKHGDYYFRPVYEEPHHTDQHESYHDFEQDRYHHERGHDADYGPRYVHGHESGDYRDIHYDYDEHYEDYHGYAGPLDEHHADHHEA